MKFQHKYSQRVYEVLDFDVITISLTCGNDERTITTEHLEEYFNMVSDNTENVEVSIVEEIESEVSKVEIPIKEKGEKIMKPEKKIVDKNEEISLKEMCDELEITTRKARATLRKEGIPKPGKQWVWKDYDVAQVTKKILEQNK